METATTYRTVLPPFTKLNPAAVPPLLGDDINERLQEALDLLDLSHFAPYLIGPSGSGKTHFLKKLAAIWSERHSVPAYYLQLSPETTKTTIIMGHRMIEGTYMPVEGVVATGMRQGAIICIDEATHTLSSNLLDFNSIIERDGMVAIGDMLAERSETCRLVFSSNDDSHVGNIRLPQSFAQRLLPLSFDYPAYESEVRIALALATAEIMRMQIPLLVPECVARFLTSYIREMRTPELPLSARNVAQALIRLHRDRWRMKKPYDMHALDQHFLTNPDAITKRIAERLFPQMSVTSVTQLVKGQTVEFKTFVSNIGVERFRELVCASCMLTLPLDGMVMGGVKHRQHMRQALL